MVYRALGQTGIRVSPLCLGAMMFGAWGNRDHDEAVRIIHRALDAGINFIDTADVYGAGESEEIVGKALVGRRDDVVVATKFTGQMGEGANRQGHSRKWVVEEVENSLRRLGTDYIDLYQAHRPDPSTDVDELLGTLSDLVHQGKVRAIGSSTFPAHAIVEGQWVAERRGRERFLCEQPPYSIFVRGIERDVLPVCAQFGMGVIPWSPLAGGWLAGKYRKGQPMPTTGRVAMQAQRFDVSQPDMKCKLDVVLDIVEELVTVAAEAVTTLIDLALGFVLAHPAVTAAIIGPRTMDQLDEQLPSLETALPAEVLDRIDGIVAPGTNLDKGDASGWDPPAITDKRLRRRS